VLTWLRAASNALIFPLWTALSVTAGLCASWLTRDRDLFYRWQRGWARGLFRLCGIKLHVTGTENMDPDGAYVIVANHASYLDIPALFAALPKLPQFMAKSDLARIPFLGAALRAGRHILVVRGSHGAARGSLEAAASHLKSGAAIMIFPEGTRATRDVVGRFKPGAFRLAKLGQRAILPVGISGTRHVLPKHGRLIKARGVSVRIGAPLSAAEVEGTPLSELSEKVRLIVTELSGLAPGDDPDRTSAAVAAEAPGTGESIAPTSGGA